MESAGGLATLAIRPPTPPKETYFVTAGKNIQNEAYLPSISGRNLDTPEESPSSSVDYFARSSDRLLKRVDFLPGESKFLTTISKSIIAYENGVRSLPPSRECKPSKSILKPCKDNQLFDPVGAASEHRQRSFPTMLEDVVRELAGSSRSSRLDAYQTLNGCLKAYEDVPGLQAMVEKMPLLTGYIRRDLTTISEGGILDTQLTTQVLKLLTIFLWTPRLAEILQDDFCIFILNQSTSVLGDSSSSKTLVNHYMHLLATQKFRSKIMTDDRANRLVNVLKDITTYVKGNGVVGQRLMIYRTLLSQSNALMLRRVDEWLDHLFSGMLSNIKEVRARALAFGFDASLSLGTVSQVSRCVLDIFNRQSSDGKRFSDLLVRRLNDMVATKEEGFHVPQVWSVVVLFLRCRRSQLEHWEHMRIWLVIIQKCFNSTENLVKFQAHIAWNRLVFAIGPTVSTGSSMIKMLRQPIMAQLDRKHDDKQSKQAKQVAYACYCTLLYYAFRPLSSPDGVDRFWDEYVALLLSKTDTIFACKVLVSLLGEVPPRIWNENRANENALIKPEELPRLDPKWVRLRAGTVLKVLDTLLQSEDWYSTGDGEAWVLQAWRSFTRALGDAGSKEVKTSVECMSAMAYMMISIKKFWVYCNKPHIGDVFSESRDLQRLAALVDIAVTNLGPLPFTEKRLVRSAGDSFEAAETPSNRSTKTRGFLASPILHLIDMISSTLTSTAANSCEDTLRGFINIALRPASSRRSKLKVLLEIASLTDPELEGSPIRDAALWQLVSEFLAASMATSKSDDGPTENPYQPGLEYRDMLRILELEAQSSKEVSRTWVATFKQMNVRLSEEYGSGGSVISLIEPFATFLHQQLKANFMAGIVERTIILVRNISWPESRKEMERAHKVLWAASSAQSKSSSFSPFDQTYNLLDNLLIAAYPACTGIDQNLVTELLKAITSLIDGSPLSQSAIVLKRLQLGVAIWIEDTEGHLNQDDAQSRAVYLAVLQMWEVIVNKIRNLPRFDTHIMSILERLIFAGLSSQHKATLNLSITSWNDTFGATTGNVYPSSLHTILRRLRLHVDLQVPGLPITDNETEDGLPPLDLIETPGNSQQTFFGNNQPGARNEETETSLLNGVQSVNLTTLPTRVVSTPEPGPETRLQRSSTTPKLRHNDSQIAFAVIDSSPSGPEGPDSQSLTTRQREVRERQHQDAAAMFPDLRSSPRPKSRETASKISKLELGTRLRLKSREPVEELISPTLPPANAMSTTFLGSSPTPWSSKKRFSESGYDDGPPSSPPVVQRNKKQAKAKIDEPVTASHEVSSSKESSVQSKVEDQSRNQTPIPESICYQNFCANLNGPATAETPTPETDGPHSTLPEKDGTDINMNSDFQFLADAPVGPSNQTLDGVKDSDPDSARRIVNIRSALMDPELFTNTDATSSPSSSPGARGILTKLRTAVLSDPYDEVAAQIAADMERALSQVADCSTPGSYTEDSEQDNPKKRKRPSLSPEISIKRRNPEHRCGAVEIVIEKRATEPQDEDMLDCIVVESPAVLAVSQLTAEVRPVGGHAELQSEAYNNKARGRLADEPGSKSRGRHGNTLPLHKRGGKKIGRPRRPILGVTGDNDSDISPADTTAKYRCPSLASSVPVEREEPGDGDSIQGSSVDPNAIRRSSPTNEYPPRSAASSAEMAPRSDDAASRAKQTAEKSTMASEYEQELQAVHTPAPHQAEAVCEDGDGASSDMDPGSSRSRNPEPRTGAGILERLKAMLEEVKGVTLEPGDGREIISTWMDLGRELQDAERRAAS